MQQSVAVVVAQSCLITQTARVQKIVSEVLGLLHLLEEILPMPEDERPVINDGVCSSTSL
jgi:hypothetical protein